MLLRNLLSDVARLGKLHSCKPGCYFSSLSSTTACHVDASRVRNFAIIAHVDHGKSTLADRILELTHAVKKGGGHDRLLDSLEVEKQRGITVKSQTASMYPCRFFVYLNRVSRLQNEKKAVKARCLKELKFSWL